MATRIRLKRMGAKKKPFYRIVVADSRSPRDGRFIEEIGYYDPMKNPAEVNIDEEKAIKWLKTGAQPSETVRALLNKAGVNDKTAVNEEVAVNDKTAVNEEVAVNDKTAVNEEVAE